MYRTIQNMGKNGSHWACMEASSTSILARFTISMNSMNWRQVRIHCVVTSYFANTAGAKTLLDMEHESYTDSPCHQCLAHRDRLPFPCHGKPRCFSCTSETITILKVNLIIVRPAVFESVWRDVRTSYALIIALFFNILVEYYERNLQYLLCQT